MAEAGAGRVTPLSLAPAAEGGEAFCADPPWRFGAPRALVGDAVQATAKPYGIEFAYADNRQAFFPGAGRHLASELAGKPL